MNLHLPFLDIPSGSCGVSSLHIQEGWVSFAITRKGFLAVRFVYPDANSAFKAIEATPPAQRLDNIPLTPAEAAPWKKILEKLFHGEPIRQREIPLDTQTWSVFSRKVYDCLRENVHRGTVISYGALAKKCLGNVKAARAVGRVMARNPVAPVVPCHRVVASDGKLTGYSANTGIPFKEHLLRREGVAVKEGRVNIRLLS